MRRTFLAGLAVAGLAACGKGVAQSAADSTRAVALARSDSLYNLGDRPSSTSNAPSPAKPASSRTLTLGTGTEVAATTQRTISSRHDKAGETFTATVTDAVKDGRNRVVIPAGSILTLTITELQPANDKSKADGRITILVSSVAFGGETYPVAAEITSMVHTLKGRGVGATEVEKTAAGAAIGGIAGRVIGGSSKGTIIGAVVGGAAGAAVAIETANRDVVVAAGTPLIVTLTSPLTVAVR